MLKRLTEEKLEEILEAGITEFGEQGFEKTSMSRVAGRAGISVGVLYKYYGDKDGFFLACVKKSMQELERTLSETTSREEKLLAVRGAPDSGAPAALPGTSQPYPYVPRTDLRKRRALCSRPDSGDRILERPSIHQYDRTCPAGRKNTPGRRSRALRFFL